MSWLLCCIRLGALGESSTADARSNADRAAKPASPSKTTTGNSLSVRIVTSVDQEKDLLAPKPLVHASSSRVRTASQHGLRLSEDTFISALSTTPTSLSPFAYVFPFVNDENEELSTCHTHEGVDALGSTAAPPLPRSKVGFADLCGSLEDLVYMGEGSNGVVYSASWHGARVAVKFLLGSHDDSTHVQRCLTEAVLTRVLSHPCVVQCFATAVAHLTPEVWEAIRIRCRRHQSILQSSSLGRSVVAAVQQQEQQERASLDVLEQQQQQYQQQQQQQQPPPGDRRSGPPRRLQSQSPLQLSRQSPSPPSQQQQQQQHHLLQDQQQVLLSLSQSLSQAQAQLLLLQSQDRDRGSAQCRSRMASGGESSSEQAMGEVLSPSQQLQQPQQHQQPEQHQHQQPSPRPHLSHPSQRPRPHSVCAAGSELLPGEDKGTGGGEGISLMQVLMDLKAEVGRHCTVVVMECMDAGTLHQAIVRGDFSAWRSPEHRSKLLALLLTAQELAQGMAHLHGLDILHGDLKPTNVLLKGSPCQFVSTGQCGGVGGGGGGGGLTCTDPRGYTAKIADLGLARTCVGGTAALSSDQWGALAYLAPEAAKGSCCKASDVYSFGVMLWEMSAGVRPYLGLTTPQVLMGLVTGTLQLTWPSDGSLYDPLRSLAIACTDFNPAERPTFEVAVRILARMVRHIRSAAEPLRQRHNSALSVEAAAVAAAAGAATAGGGGGAKCVLNHASRSMPMYMPTAVAAVAANSITQTVPLQPATPLTQKRELPGAPGTPAIGAVSLASSSQLYGNGGVTTAPLVAVARASVSPSHQRLPLRYDTWEACSSGMATTSRSCSGSGPCATTAVNCSGNSSAGGATAAAVSPTVQAGAAGGHTAGASSWSATPMHPHAYPRTRRAAGGGVCGGAVLRSPLGAAGAATAIGTATGFPQRPSAPCDPREVALRPSAPSVERAARGRPESSPAHSQF